MSEDKKLADAIDAHDSRHAAKDSPFFSAFEEVFYRHGLALEELDLTIPGHERPHVPGFNLSPGEPRE